MIANLCQALVKAPIDLDVLLIKAQGPYVDRLPDSANIISLRAQHSLTSVWEMARYLKRERPDALLAVKHRGILAALRARQLAMKTTYFWVYFILLPTVSGFQTASAYDSELQYNDWRILETTLRVYCFTGRLPRRRILHVCTTTKRRLIW